MDVLLGLHFLCTHLIPSLTIRRRYFHISFHRIKVSWVLPCHAFWLWESQFSLKAPLLSSSIMFLWAKFQGQSTLGPPIGCAVKAWVSNLLIVPRSPCNPVSDADPFRIRQTTPAGVPFRLSPKSWSLWQILLLDSYTQH